MEESKKEVKMTAINGGKKSGQGEQRQKLTYEELNNACIELQQQNRNLIVQLQQMDLSNAFRRLEYLFRVVECAYDNRNNSVSFSTEFLERCIAEIEATMTISPNVQEKQESKEE